MGALLVGTLMGTVDQVFAAEPPPYRRFIEAEQMMIEGKGYQVVPRQGSSGHAVVEASFSSAEQAAAGGRLIQTLERTLPPGSYAVWVQLHVPSGGRTNGPPISVEVDLGGSKQILSFAGRRENEAAGTVVAATVAFPTVAIAVRSAEPRVLLDRVYLSNRPGDLRPNAGLKTDEIDLDGIQREMSVKVSQKSSGFPSYADARAPDPPNWLENGSFEVGFGSDQWSTPYQLCYALTPECWDATQASEGKQSLAVRFYASGRRWQEDDPSLPTDFAMFHRILKLKPNKTYWFRGMFRSDAPVALSLSATTAYDTPAGVGAVTAQVGGEWKAVEMPIKTTDDARGYFLRVSATSPGAARLWMDAFTLSENKLTEFVPSAPVEVGLHWTAPGKIFYADEPADMTLLARNHVSKNPARVSLRYRVVDYFDQTVIEESLPDWSLDSEATQSRVLHLNKGRTGVFRLIVEGKVQARGGAQDLPLREVAFSILPRPPAAMKRTFGSYFTLAPEPVEILSRAGIRRTVTLSCANELLQVWNRIETAPGKFNWADQRVADARKRDVAVLGNIDLGENASAIPEWARNPADPADVLKASGSRMTTPVKFSKKAWTAFIEKVVGHYKDTIQDWLLIDEPYHYQTPEEYTEVMKASYAAAKRANPNCRVIAHGGFGEAWMSKVEKAGGVPFFDGISDYARNRKQGEFLKVFSRKHRKFVLTVEYLWQTSMYETIETPALLMERFTPWYQDVTAQVTGAISAMCWAGAEGFNLYDARYPGADFTQIDKYKSSFEFDGALKPTGVAYAIMAGLLDGFRGVEELNLHPRLETFLLEDDTRFAIALRTRNHEIAETSLALPKEVRALDFMGNPTFSSRPTLLPNYALDYLVGPKAALEKTRAALSAASLSEAVRVKTELVTDPRTGQPTLAVTVLNRRADRPLKGVLKLVSGALRDFWDSVREVSLKPGGSVILSFGLNSYKGDRPATLEADARIEFFFEGAILKQAILGLAEDASAYMKQADDFAAAGKQADAEAVYRSIVVGLPEGSAPEVQMKLARCLAAQGKVGDAAAEYRKVGAMVGARPPQAVAAAMALGGLLEGQKKWDEALAEYRKIPSAKGLPVADAVALPMRMGGILQAQRKFAEAAAEYRKIASIPGAGAVELVAAQMKVGEVLAAQAQYDEAVAEYGKVAAIAGATPLDLATAQVASGGVFELRRQYDEASTRYRAAAGVKGLSPAALANLHYEAARTMRARANPLYQEEIISEYRAAIAIKEAWSTIGACAQLYLGKYLQDSKRYDEALAEYRMVLATPGANEVYVKEAREQIQECLKQPGIKPAN